MVKLQQFNARASYVTPSVKSVVLKSKRTILAGSDPDFKSGEGFSRQSDWLNDGGEWE